MRIMKYTHLCLIAIVLILVGCSKSTLSVSQFRDYHPLTELNGTYLSGNPNSSNSLVYILNKGEFHGSSKEVSYITLNFNGKDTLNVKFFSDSAVLKEMKYKGEIKDGYFEIYFSKKKLLIPFVVTNIDYRRVRLGLAEDKSLLVHYWEDHLGGMLIFYGAYNYENAYIYERINDWSVSDYQSFTENGKWGVKKKGGQMIIDAGYDAITPFDSLGIAKAKKGDKWALIDNSGELRTSFDYSSIGFYDRGMGSYLVEMTSLYNTKTYGYINEKGETVIPVEHEDIRNTNVDGVKMIRKGRDYGFIAPGRMISPPVLSGVYEGFDYLKIKGADPGMKYRKVVYKGTWCYLGLDGYLYRFTTNFWSNPSKLTDSIKIGYDF